MAIVSAGQITITDLNDAISLSAFIAADKAITQRYSPDTNAWTPNWGVSAGAITLTPQLFITGVGSDIIMQAKSVNWFSVVGATATEITTTTAADGTAYIIAATSAAPKKLVVRKNIAKTDSSALYRCKITYTDPATNLDVYTQADLLLQINVSGTSIITADIETPQGIVFKNSGTASLKLVGKLWRGGTYDISSIAIVWGEQDAAVTAPTSTGYDATLGLGWRKLVTGGNYTIGTSTAADNGTAAAGAASDMLTVKNDAVLSVRSYKVAIKDTDSNSGTVNSVATAVITLNDQTDPIGVIINSTGGDVFKNGQGSTTLKALLYQDGVEIDTAGSTYTYTWTKMGKNGTAENFSGAVASKTGKTISVGDADVDVKATFFCSVATK
jgi:hypothetical protein